MPVNSARMLDAVHEKGVVMRLTEERTSPGAEQVKEESGRRLSYHMQQPKNGTTSSEGGGYRRRRSTQAPGLVDMGLVHTGIG